MMYSSPGWWNWGWRNLERGCVELGAWAKASGGMVNSAETEKKSEPANAMGAARFLLFLVLVVVTTWLFLPVSLLGFICLCSFIVLVIKEEVRYRAEERSRMDDAERSRVNKKRTCEEGESLRWLNEGMKRIWPMSTEFASTYFFGPMASTFLDKYKPRGSGLVEATIDVSTLCLGNTPPEFYCIQTLEQSMDGYDVAYEARMVFHADERMTAQMKVVLNFLGTYNIYISGLRIEGTVCNGS
nr:C2 domain-containing protein At1g53590-like isoform X1 [Physcomitrium patens]|eukprot:XP_024374951.1 C2 domain-containing protein At1g53590-like isoform X1 [Physcomitrella patens]